MAFSSNRFVWVHQIHKLELLVELTEALMNKLPSIQLLKSSDPVLLAATNAGARVARIAFRNNQGACA
jgi:hypothetical protein